MKHLIKHAALVILTGALLFSCEKKDNEIEITGNLNIGNQTYQLTSGSLWNYGQAESSYDGYEGFELGLTLASKGLSLITGDEGWQDVAGEGFYFDCIIYSASKDAFIEGEYEFRSNYSGSFPTGTFAFSGYGEYSDKDEKYTWNDITAGTITIEKNGDIYTITIDCADGEGNEVSGEYTGKLTYHYPPAE